MKNILKNINMGFDITPRSFGCGFRLFFPLLTHEKYGFIIQIQFLMIHFTISFYKK